MERKLFKLDLLIDLKKIQRTKFEKIALHDITSTERKIHCIKQLLRNDKILNILHCKISLVSLTGDECRIILFEEPIPNKAISGHVIRILEVPNEGSCRTICYMEPDCVSINVRPSEGGKYKCELNNATVDVNQLTFLDDRDTTYYLAIEVNVLVWLLYSDYSS